MSAPFKRLLGMTFDNEPIFASQPSHSLLTAAAGAGKSSAGLMTWLLSLAADTSRAMVILDSKNAEIALQVGMMLEQMGRKVAIIDQMRILPVDHPLRVDLNPLGDVIAANRAGRGALIFAIENATNALIPEPPDGDAKNVYFRDGPREFIEFAIRALLKRETSLVSPGAVWGILADPSLLRQVAEIEAEEGDETLRSLSRSILDLAEHNEEHFAQHRAAAVKALRIYGADSLLHDAGLGATLTHHDLLRENYVTFIVGPQQYMARLGAHYSLHIQSFLNALYDGASNGVDFFLEEATNAPLKTLVSALTTMRGFGGACHFVAQSRSELQRAFGERETATIEENSIVKQFFGFSSFEEAERVSQAIGEDKVLTQSLNYSSGKLELSGTLGMENERLFTPERLMRLPNDEQIIMVKGVGVIHCKKVYQNQIEPFCHSWLDENPLEGPQLPADPRVKIDVPTGMRL